MNNFSTAPKNIHVHPFVLLIQTGLLGLNYMKIVVWSQVGHCTRLFNTGRVFHF